MPHPDCERSVSDRACLVETIDAIDGALRVEHLPRPTGAAVLLYVLEPVQRSGRTGGRMRALTALSRIQAEQLGLALLEASREGQT